MEVYNIFSPATDAVADVELSFEKNDGKYSLYDIAMKAYDMLLEEAKKANDVKEKNLYTEKAWDIAVFYGLGDEKVQFAKGCNLLLQEKNNTPNNIVKIPGGETKDSFLKCRIGNFHRIHDLYKFILKDIHCYDGDLQQKIVKLEMEMLDIIRDLEGIK